MYFKLLFEVFFVVSSCISCASLFRSDVETRLVSEMGGNCKKVEIKMDYYDKVYVIEYTGKVSKDKCPIALIQAWKDGGLIEKKEVEICGCRKATAN